MGSLRLNSHAPFPAVLRVLNVRVPGSALPCRVRCPLCGGRLNVYEDTISGGAWHYCFDCRSAGDMIELAAACWDVSPRTAVARLARLGMPFPAEDVVHDRVVRYVADHPHTRRRMNDLWRRTSEYLAVAHSPELTRLKQTFRLHHQLSQDRWAAGPGNLVGAYPAHAIKEALGEYDTHKVRVSFRGRGWGDVIVVPFQDMPGRVSGFLCAGRGGGPEDFVFYAPGYQRRQAPHKAEGGLAGLWAVEESKGMFGQHCFVVGDAMFALRLQTRHYAVSSRPLPLAAYYDGPDGLTKAAWLCLSSRQPVLWGWTLTASLLNQAVSSDGLVSLVPAEDTRHDVDHYVRNNEPADMLRKALKRAKPWRHALVEWAEGTADGPVEELLHGMETYGHDTAELARLSGRLSHLLKVPAAPPSVRVGNWTVYECGDEWWACRAHQSLNRIPVMNARMRIDTVTVKDTHALSPRPNRLRLNHKQVPHYRGRLIHQGTTVPFEIPISTMTHRGAEQLAGLLATAKGVLLQVARGWGSGMLIRAATQFQTPAENPDLVGQDASIDL
jgi:hypothetical protein